MHVALENECCMLHKQGLPVHDIINISPFDVKIPHQVPDLMCLQVRYKIHKNILHGF